MPEKRNRYRFMCQDTGRAALNRNLVKERLFTEGYPDEAQLKARGVPVQIRPRVEPLSE